MVVLGLRTIVNQALLSKVRGPGVEGIPILIGPTVCRTTTSELEGVKSSSVHVRVTVYFIRVATHAVQLTRPAHTIHFQRPVPSQAESRAYRERACKLC